MQRYRTCIDTNERQGELAFVGGNTCASRTKAAMAAIIRIPKKNIDYSFVVCSLRWFLLTSLSTFSTWRTVSIRLLASMMRQANNECLDIRTNVKKRNFAVPSISIGYLVHIRIIFDQMFAITLLRQWRLDECIVYIASFIHKYFCVSSLLRFLLNYKYK